MLRSSSASPTPASLLERSLGASAELRRLHQALFELESRRRELFRELSDLSARP